MKICVVGCVVVFAFLCVCVCVFGVCFHDGYLPKYIVTKLASPKSRHCRWGAKVAVALVQAVFRSSPLCLLSVKAAAKFHQSHQIRQSMRSGELTAGGLDFSLSSEGDSARFTDSSTRPRKPSNSQSLRQTETTEAAGRSAGRLAYDDDDEVYGSLRGVFTVPMIVMSPGCHQLECLSVFVNFKTPRKADATVHHGSIGVAARPVDRVRLADK